MDKVIELVNRASNGQPRSVENAHLICMDELEKLVQIVRDDYRAELLEGSGEPVAWGKYSTFTKEVIDSITPSEHLYFVGAYTAPLHTADQLAAAVLRATEQATARANASWQLMCEKMVQAERERCLACYSPNDTDNDCTNDEKFALI